MWPYRMQCFEAPKLYSVLSLWRGGSCAKSQPAIAGAEQQLSN